MEAEPSERKVGRLYREKMNRLYAEYDESNHSLYLSKIAALNLWWEKEMINIGKDSPKTDFYYVKRVRWITLKDFLDRDDASEFILSK